jgi:hypothetical protein
VSSVRLLLPLEILMEFVDSLCLVDQMQDVGDETYQVTKADFWKSIVDVGQLVQQYLHQHHLQVPSTEKDDSTYPSFRQLKEYQALRGYRSFHIMNEKDWQQLCDGFVDAAEAVEVLELNPISQSQETAGTSIGSVVTTGPEESKIKLFRFMTLCQKFSSSESKAPLSTSSKDGSLMFVSVKDTVVDDDSMSIGAQQMQLDPDHLTAFMDDEAGDVVLYHVPQLEAVQPLLPPGSHPSQSTKSPPSAGDGPSSKTMEVACPKEESVSIKAFPFEQPDVGICNAPNLPSTISVMPPPGFGPLSTQVGQTPLGRTINNVTTSAPGTNSPTNESILLRIIQGQTGTGPSRNIFPVDSHVDIGSWHNPSVRHHKLSGDQGLTIAESPHLFGDMYTANPFAQTLQSHTSLSSSNIPFGLSENGHHQEETALFDSGLWNSLFGEVTTKNPWATK